MKRIAIIAFFLFTMITLPTTGYCGELISYQGQLTDTNGVAVSDTTYAVQFSLFPDSSGSGSIWTESATITTSGGLFQHSIGSITTLEFDIFTDNPTLFLELSVSGETFGVRTRLTTVPYAIVSRSLQLRGSNDAVIAETFGSSAGGLRLSDTLQETVIELNSALSSDLSVQLPDSAINSKEIIDEPGIVIRTNSTIVDLSTNSMTDLVSLSIEIPRDGYIVLHGKCYLLLSGTTGANSAQVQINESAGGVPEFPYYTHAGLGGYVNTAINYFPVYVTRTYFKQAGVWEFRMEGKAINAPPAVAQSWDHIFTAVYYPTDYYHFGKSGMSFPPHGIDSGGTER